MSEETRESRALPVWCCRVLAASATEAVADGREKCGLIVFDGDTPIIMELPNISDQPDNFRMGTEDLQGAYHSWGDKIVGCWHTHATSDRPSAQDAEYAPYGLRYWIATTKAVVEYDMLPPNPTEVGRWDASS